MPDSAKEKFRDAILDLFASKCQDTSQLLSEAMDHDVSAIKRLKIRFHLALCEFCCHYKEQLQTMRDIAKGISKDAPDTGEDSQLNSSAKERMKKFLEDEEK